MTYRQSSAVGRQPNKVYLLFGFHYFFIFIFCFSSPALHAQLNLGVGYNGSYADAPLINSILKRYNTTSTAINQPFKDLHFLSGIVVSAQYKLDFIGFSLQWKNKNKKLSTKSFDVASNQEDFRDLFFRNNNYSIGFSFFLHFFSFGSTLDYNNFAIFTAHTNHSDRYKVLSNKIWSTHFFLNFQLYKNDNMSFNLQPYWHWPWAKNDFFALEQELNPSFALGANPIDYKSRFKNFGVSLIFYNGQQ